MMGQAGPEPAAVALPSRRAVRLGDAVAVTYVLLCVAAGVVAGLQIWALAELHRGLVQTAEAFDLTARAIGAVGNVPVIGGGAGQLAGSVQDAATQIREGALAARAQIRTLALVVGAAIAALPLVPVLGLYLPLRLAWRRAVRRPLGRSEKP
jgi:hypothetical protein